jgi:hypothetical protein
MEPIVTRVPPRVDRTRVRRPGTDRRSATPDDVDADQAVTSVQTSAPLHSRQHDTADVAVDPRSGAAGDPLQQTALLEAMQSGMGNPAASDAARLRTQAYAVPAAKPIPPSGEEVTA